jgi:hypothetical protein
MTTTTAIDETTTTTTRLTNPHSHVLDIFQHTIATTSTATFQSNNFNNSQTTDHPTTPSPTERSCNIDEPARLARETKKKKLWTQDKKTHMKKHFDTEPCYRRRWLPLRQAHHR